MYGMLLEDTDLFESLVEKSQRMKDVQISHTKLHGPRFINIWLEYLKRLSETNVPLESKFHGT